MSAIIDTLLLTPLAHAQEAVTALNPPAPCDFVRGGFGEPGSMFYCVANYASMLTYVVIGFAASLSLVMLIINGFRYMIGPAFPGGSSDAAKKGITSALTGLAVSLLTYILLDTLIRAVTQ